MNRIIGIVSRGISNLAKNIKAIVNTVSQPKDKPNGGIYTGSSPVTIGGAGIDHVIPKSSKQIANLKKKVAKEQKIPEELYQVHVMGAFIESDQIVSKEEPLKLEIDQENQPSSNNYSINRQLSYTKKKTQQKNWTKWKRGNR
ncbi:hypothetical protein [Bacillus luti]|uniref:hypothetical protein n=1 Tax=Bacillus luti TaxID=2026191 RepID=UPI00289B1022|nr:hypothetical protein [Bacillus luti]